MRKDNDDDNVDDDNDVDDNNRHSSQPLSYTLLLYTILLFTSLYPPTEPLEEYSAILYMRKLRHREVK